jgi:hypothetical protein
LGFSSQTSIIIILILGWLVSRLILQTRFSQRHSYWMDQRKQKRSQVLESRRKFQKVEPAEIRGLDLKFYEAMGRELQTQGFRPLGTYEDLTFSEAFPHLRTCHSAWVLSEDGSVLATVGHLKERRWWRRMILAVRGIPRDLKSVDLTTTFPSGAGIKTSRGLSTTERIIPPETLPGVYRHIRSSKENLATMIEHHRDCVKDLHRETGEKKGPVVISDLEGLFRLATGKSPKG